MRNSTDDLATLSALTLEWHRAATETPEDAFQIQALERLSTRLPFDAAFWASGHHEDGRPVVHNFVLVNRPAEMLADYAKISHEDQLGAQCAAAPGTAFVANAIPERTDTTPPVLQYLKKWRIAHALSCHTVDDVSRLSTAVSLWRGAERNPFESSCRRFFELSIPHLVSAAAANRLHHLRHGLQTGRAESGGAVADRQGVLQLITPDFQQFLRAEWPAWRGPRLPEPLTRLLADAGVDRHVGARAVFRATRSSDLVFLQARVPCAVDSLSTRERQIAQLVVQGLTRREIAQRLSIAPSTARNHLSSVFLKLDIRKQSELAAKLLGGE